MEVRSKAKMLLLIIMIGLLFESEMFGLKARDNRCLVRECASAHSFPFTLSRRKIDPITFEARRVFRVRFLNNLNFQMSIVRPTSNPFPLTLFAPNTFFFNFSYADTSDSMR